jgi:omega-amidase
MTIKISLAQTNISFGNPEDNYEKGLVLIDQASNEGCDLILFPELWTTGYDLTNIKFYTQQNDAILNQLKFVAKNKKISIGGSYIFRIEDRFYNSFIIINSDGDICSIYNKLHLIKIYKEDLYFTPGDQIQVNTFQWGKAGLAICYDLRFPEMFRKMALNPVEIFLLVAEWPAKRIEHWRILIRARAIENQVFVAAVNSVGLQGTELYGGCSCIISPSGEILAEAEPEQERLIISEIDLDSINESRKSMNILQDRRFDIY